MEEGKVPSSNSSQKRLYVFEEKLERGETLVPILGDPSQKAFGTTLRVGSKGGLLSLSIERRRFLGLKPSE